ncbi:MAG TPA: hydrogenase/urease maturation nickel metallochaperone HypA [Gaiellaceae bacterium]|jgi:hydrogenase nickel incorporation protein HypA/HybF
MHERALMVDVMRKIDEIATEGGADRVVVVGVRLGALSHFTPDHFREHFVDASRGTIAEGAEVDAVVDDDTTGDRARDVVIERVEIELPDRAEVH